MKRVLVDTYALIAATVDALTPNAERVLKSIRVGGSLALFTMQLPMNFNAVGHMGVDITW